MLLNPPDTPVIVPPNSLVAAAEVIVAFDSAAPCSVSVPPTPPFTEPVSALASVNVSLPVPPTRLAVIGVFTLKALPLFPPVTVAAPANIVPAFAVYVPASRLAEQDIDASA